MKEYDIFINEVTPSLKAFIQMVSDYYILGKSKNIQYYISLTDTDFQKAREIGYIETLATGLRIYDHPIEFEHQMQFSIDPFQMPSSINYQLDAPEGESGAV